MKKNVLVVAGEKSGEEHFLSFYPELKEKLGQDVSFFGVGGDQLSAIGVELIYHLKDFSSMGFSIDVLKKIPFYFKAMDQLVDLCRQREVKVAILIDFQGFNLKIAKRLNDMGVKVMYYVAPQAWVWKENRVKTLKEVTHKLFCIVPFEKDWFQKRGVSQSVSVPHPVWQKNKELVRRLERKVIFENEKVKLLLLPGSRNFEVSLLLPVFAEALLELKSRYDLDISIVKTSSVDERLYNLYDGLYDRSYQAEKLNDALVNSDFCFAASGTVTLQCAVYKLPTIVCYKVSLLNEFVIRNIMKYSGFASLTNLILKKEIFPELMQADANSSQLVKKFENWIKSKMLQEEVLNERDILKDKLSHSDYNVGEYMAQIINEEYQ
jgi:lipid-A-disaccharide synthase